MDAYVLIAISLAALIHGYPVPDNETITVKKEHDVSGFFIPKDTWESFQNQLQPKTNQPMPTTNNQEQNVIKLLNQPISSNPDDAAVNEQINVDQNIPPNINSPIILNHQPDMKNQPLVLQPGQFVVSKDSKTGQTILIQSGNVQGNQPNKPIILVQQPSQNNPLVLPQQPKQPLYVQPGQNFILQNGQDGNPSHVLVSIPSNNQGAFTNAQPDQNQGTVYTLVSNNQNTNPSQNGNLYLIPVQSGSSNPIILRPAK